MNTCFCLIFNIFIMLILILVVILLVIHLRVVIRVAAVRAFFARVVNLDLVALRVEH
jgi:hypothetical protein